MFDGASERMPRHLIPLMPHQSSKLVDEQSSVATFRVVGYAKADVEPKEAEHDVTFHSNNEVWRSVIHGGLRSPVKTVCLDNFFLFEWFPRSPGLFHTNDGIESRQRAKQHIKGIEDGTVVYDPYGKISMLDGGVGTLRLQPIEIGDESIYLMTASSTGTCDQGFPVGLSQELYGRCYDEILERGCVVHSLVGKLRFLPKSFADVYRAYREVPELYLHVEELAKPTHPKTRSVEELRVSVAVSFISDYEGPTKVYASYVSFDPADGNSFRESIEWLEREYVANRYRGQIITDFDEQQGHFRNATFSLTKIMNLQLQLSELAPLADQLGIDTNRILSRQDHLRIEIGELYMGSKYNITGGNQGAVGDNASAQNFTQVWNGIGSNIDLPTLKEELDKLRQEARSLAKTRDQDAAVVAIADAEAAAAAGDGPTVLKHLAKAGSWAIDVATKIGVTVAASALKSAMGIP